MLFRIFIIFIVSNNLIFAQSSTTLRKYLVKIIDIDTKMPFAKPIGLSFSDGKMSYQVYPRPDNQYEVELPESNFTYDIICKYCLGENIIKVADATIRVTRYYQTPLTINVKDYQQAFNQKIKEKEVIIDTREREISRQARKISTQQSTISGQSQIIKNQQTTISDKDKSIQNLEKEKSELITTNQAKDKKIETQTKTIEVCNDDNKSLTDTLKIVRNKGEHLIDIIEDQRSRLFYPFMEAIGCQCVEFKKRKYLTIGYNIALKEDKRTRDTIFIRGRKEKLYFDLYIKGQEKPISSTKSPDMVELTGESQLIKFPISGAEVYPRKGLYKLVIKNEKMQEIGSREFQRLADNCKKEYKDKLPKERWIDSTTNRPPLISISKSVNSTDKPGKMIDSKKISIQISELRSADVEGIDDNDSVRVKLCDSNQKNCRVVIDKYRVNKNTPPRIIELNKDESVLVFEHIFMGNIKGCSATVTIKGKDKQEDFKITPSLGVRTESITLRVDPRVWHGFKNQQK